jgi:dTDP-4-amino-4,6-dideoxygalactose transaminase
MYVVQVPGAERNALVQHLRARGVHADLRYAPCHRAALFGQQAAALPVTEAVTAELLSLPLFVGMTLEDVAKVADLLRDYFRQEARRGHHT